MSDYELLLGDCLDLLPRLPEGGADAVVTDPPYDLLSTGGRNGSGRSNPGPGPFGRTEGTGGFMGLRWDATGVAFRPETWAAVARCLKPGGYLLAFGGTRTWHRLACALEDAGFELRDTLCWLYGTGFPKGDGCLKPSWEPVLLCRRPGPRVLPLGVDECRIEVVEGDYDHPGNTAEFSDTSKVYGWAQSQGKFKQSPPSPAGRWPANLILSEDAAALLDEASGERVSGGGPLRRGATTGTSIGGHGIYGTQPRQHDGSATVIGDRGGASRFFYCSKASRAEREAGLAGLPAARWTDGRAVDADYPSLRGATDRVNSHPCVKPLDLMKWLVRLVCPPGGLVLDPFLGSGTTALSCYQTDRRCIGIEKEAEYLKIAEARLAAVRAEYPLFEGSGW